MRRIVIMGFLALATLAAGTVWAQKSNLGGLRSDEVNEGQVRSLYERFTAAWNDHNVSAMSAMWALDGDHQEPDGRMAKGRSEITALLKKQHDTVFGKTQLDLTIDDVWFIGGNMALIDGAYKIKGIVAPDGKVLPERAGHLTAILLHEQGQWWIAASRLMIPAPLPWRKS